MANRVPGFGRAGQCLVGRAEELAALGDLLASARSGTGGTALVDGPAGIGKTALLGAARAMAERDRMRVLHARGTELERDFPMGIARQCLERTLRSAEDRERGLRGPARLAEPVLVDPADAVEPPSVGMLHGLFWLVANLSEAAPALLVVDDAQWADEASLRFLAYLARRVESLPVAVVLGVRTEGVARPAGGAALDEIARDPTTIGITPAPLGVEGVGRLLEADRGAAVAGAFARACHEATGGNPFLLGELLRALRDRGVPGTEAGVPQVAEVTPPSVARTVAATLDRLGPAAAALAGAAAVLGDGAGLELAAELGGVPAAHAPETAAQLVRAGILDDATVLRFRHPILTGAVRAALPAPERAAAHGRAAALLRARGAGSERVAVQLLHAAPSADMGVVAELRLAAEHARERGAPTIAAGLLHRALAEPPAGAVRAQVLLELGSAELAVGEMTDAADHLEAAQRCAADPLTRGRALSLLPHARPGDPALRRRLLEIVERTLPEVEPRDRELALRLRAVTVLIAGAPAPVPPGDTVGEAVLLGNLVFARMGPDATAAGIGDIAARAARQVEGLLEDGVGTVAFAGIALGLRWADRLEEAGRALDVAIDVARRRGLTSDFASAMTLRAAVRRRAGRLRDAEADARLALAAACDSAWTLGRGIVPLTACLLDRGRVQEAAQELAAAGGDGEIPDAPPLTPVLLARMHVRAAARAHERALADWQEALRRVRLRGVSASWIEDLAVVADVQRAAGDADAARATVAQALELARRWDTPGAIGQALRARARTGAAGEEVDALRDAVEHLERSPVRLEHAHALVDLGAALRRRGHRTDSRDPLREGFDLAQRCGAEALAERARAELRSSGIRLQREALTGVDALTPSERRIAALAAGGLSNAEIAQELFLTVKTVEMHLTQAYRKLDVRGRAALARALA